MSNQQIKDINKEAYKQAEEALAKEKVEVVKGYILNTLKKIDETKKRKETIEEELRILNKDLEDLRNGDFSKIEERINKSALAKSISQVPVNMQYATVTTTSNPTVSHTAYWNNATSGTYATNCRTYYI